MGNKYDLQSWWLYWTAESAINTYDIGAQVADGKTRFITHIRVNRKADILHASKITEIEVYFATQTSGASFMSTLALAKAGGQLALQIPAVSEACGVRSPDMTFVEMKGTIKQPLLTISGGSYPVVGLSSAAHTLFVQYFDE